MSYRPTTHPHRVTITMPIALWQRIEDAADVDHDRSAVIRAAILASRPWLELDNSASCDNRRAATERHALRLCSECVALVVEQSKVFRPPWDKSPGCFARALRELVADGLTRDWRAQLRRAEMGDAWREDAR